MKSNSRERIEELNRFLNDYGDVMHGSEWLIMTYFQIKTELKMIRLNRAARKISKYQHKMAAIATIVMFRKALDELDKE